MTLSDLKTFFRKRIKVVPGGPAVGTPGANRSQGVLDSLDALAEEVKAIGTAKAGVLSAVTLNADMAVGNKYQLSPDLLAKVAAQLAAGKKPVWILPAAGAAARTTILASTHGVAPGNSAGANATGVNKMRTAILALNP